MYNNRSYLYRFLSPSNTIIIIIFLFCLINSSSSSSNCAKECGDEGDFCGKNYKDANDTEIKECKIGLYCDESICRKKIPDNQPCKFKFSCLNPNAQCLQIGPSKICITAFYKGLGESCNSTIQCTDPLICANHICRPKKRDHCISNNECSSSDFCSLGGTCEPLPDKGGDCEFEIGCSNGLICGQKAPNEFYGKCIPIYSKQLGSNCRGHSECDIGEELYCKSNLCSKYTPTVNTDDCLKTGCDLSMEQCVCSYNSQKKDIILSAPPTPPPPSEGNGVASVRNQTRAPKITKPPSFNPVPGGSSNSNNNSNYDNNSYNNNNNNDPLTSEEREAIVKELSHGITTPSPNTTSSNQCKSKFVMSRECKEMAARLSFCSWESHCPRVDNENLESCIRRRCGLYSDCYNYKCVLHTNCYPYNGACETLEKLMAKIEHTTGESTRTIQLNNISKLTLSISLLSILFFLI